MHGNSVRLTGELSACGPLRYSPAGIPFLEFRLIHSSVQMEAGMERKVEFEIEGIAAAETAFRLSGLQGDPVRLEGFLARKGPKNREIVFHATHFELIG
ncbi:MAG TPA: primosomal replication protein N [Burkholderiales bacterium]|nr:primosomal replication protein N [Burkholderiales bacterium]